MAGSVNKVILVGNLGKDPEVRTTQDGAKIVNLTLATSETWNDRASGERKERTEWHRVVIFNDRIGEVAEKYLRKGRKVYVEGALQTRKWTDQSGQERYTTEVVIGRFRGELVLIDSSRGEEGAGMGEGGGGWRDASGPRRRARRRRRAQRRRRRRAVVGRAEGRRSGRRDPVLTRCRTRCRPRSSATPSSPPPGSAAPAWRRAGSRRCGSTPARCATSPVPIVISNHPRATTAWPT